MTGERDSSCVICRHKRIQDIDFAQAAGEPELSIAERFGVTKIALRKHFNHKTVEAGGKPTPTQQPSNVVELRPCPVCAHPKRQLVDAAIATGDTWVKIGRSFLLDPTAVRTHADKCLKGALRRSPGGDGELRGAAATAKERCRALLVKVENLIDQAESDDEASYRDRAALVTAAKGLLELLGRFTGEIGPGTEWKQIEAAIAEALTPYPEAAKAVALKLQAMEAA
jgi:hypothetical protein